MTQIPLPGMEKLVQDQPAKPDVAMELPNQGLNLSNDEAISHAKRVREWLQGKLPDRSVGVRHLGRGVFRLAVYKKGTKGEE